MAPAECLIGTQPCLASSSCGRGAASSTGADGLGWSCGEIDVRALLTRDLGLGCRRSVRAGVAPPGAARGDRPAERPTRLATGQAGTGTGADSGWSGDGSAGPGPCSRAGAREGPRFGLGFAGSGAGPPWRSSGFGSARRAGSARACRRERALERAGAAAGSPASLALSLSLSWGLLSFPLLRAVIAAPEPAPIRARRRRRPRRPSPCRRPPCRSRRPCP